MQRILARAKGTHYEIPLLLATLGLRRSEICALTSDALNGNMLTINKTLVENDNGKFVVKPYNKTPERTRKILIPNCLVDPSREKGEMQEFVADYIMELISKDS